MARKKTVRVEALKKIMEPAQFEMVMEKLERSTPRDKDLVAKFMMGELSFAKLKSYKKYRTNSGTYAYIGRTIEDMRPFGPVEKCRACSNK